MSSPPKPRFCANSGAFDWSEAPQRLISGQTCLKARHFHLGWPSRASSFCVWRWLWRVRQGRLEMGCFSSGDAINWPLLWAGGAQAILWPNWRQLCDIAIERVAFEKKFCNDPSPGSCCLRCRSCHLHLSSLQSRGLGTLGLSSGYRCCYLDYWFVYQSRILPPFLLLRLMLESPMYCVLVLYRHQSIWN